MSTLHLKIEASNTGLKEVRTLLGEFEKIVMHAGGAVKAFDSLQRGMGGIKVQSMELQGQLTKLSNDLNSTKNSAEKLAISEKKLTTENKKLVSENKKLITSNKSLSVSNEKLISENRRLKTAKDKVSKSTATQIGLQQNLNSAMRGTAGALGGLWLSYGRILPMMAAFAEVSGMKQVISLGAEFQFQMKFIEAVSNKTAVAMSGINDELLRMSAESVFGPNELAKGLRILTQSGIDPTIAGLRTLKSVMDLAILGEFTMAEASTTVQTALHSFRLEIHDIPHAVDSITKASFMAATNVREMSAALSNAAQVGSLYGISLDETNALLGIMAKSHLVGARAGTALTNMMRDLAPKSKAAASAYEALNIELYDSEGNMRPVITIFGELSKSLEKYDKASQTAILKTLQNRRGIKAMAAILPYANSELISYYNAIKKSSDGMGVASKAVGQLKDTVQGDMKLIASHIQEGMILAFQDSQVSIRELSSELEDAFTKPGFTNFLKTVVSGTVKIIKYVNEHRDTVISLGKAYLTLKVAGLAFGIFSSIGAGALKASASVRTLNASILTLKMSNPILFGITAALGFITAATLTTDNGLKKLTTSVGNLTDEMSVLLGMDILSWFDKLKQGASEILPGVIDEASMKVAKFKDIFTIPSLDDIGKNLIGQVQKLSGTLKEQAGIFHEDLAMITSGREMITAGELKIGGPSERALKAKWKAQEAARVDAKVAADKARVASERASADKLIKSVEDRYSVIRDIERGDLSVENKAKELADYDSFEAAKHSIKEKYNKLKLDAESKTNVMLFEDYILLQRKIQYAESFELSKLKDPRKIPTGGVSFISKEETSKSQVKQLEADKRFVDERLSIAAASLKQNETLLKISFDAQQTDERKHNVAIRKLRVESQKEEYGTLIAAAYHTRKILSEAGKDTEAEKSATKQLDVITAKINKLKREVKAGSEIFSAEESMRDSLEIIESVTGAREVTIALMSEERKEMESISATYESYREIVDIANERGIISLNEELQLLDKIDKAEQERLYGAARDKSYTELESVKLSLMSDQDRVLRTLEDTYESYREVVDRAQTNGIILLEEELRLLQLIDDEEKKRKPSASFADVIVKGVRSYVDSVKTMYEEMEDVSVRAFSKMEDVLVNFVITGKLNFREMADSIIADLIRIQVRQAMVSALSTTVSAIGSAIAGGMQTQSIGSTMAVRNINPTVIAHGGLTRSEKEQTVFIDKDERIVSPNQNRDLTEFLAGSKSQGIVITNHITVEDTGGDPSQAAAQGKIIGEAIEKRINDVILNHLKPGGMLNQHGAI